jgi:DNA-binding CsgD family transcriptional regulator
MAAPRTKTAKDSAPQDALVGVDAKNRIVDWNEAAARLLGVPTGEARGKALAEVLSLRDAFGNDLCPDGCWLHEMARQSEPIRVFVLEVAQPGGEPTRFWVQSQVKDTNSHSAEYQIELRLRQDRRRVDERLLNNHGDAGRIASGGDNGPTLTRRQREVLRLVADGYTTPEIAKELGISPNTVRNHEQNALRALDIHHLPGAVAIALRRRLI